MPNDLLTRRIEIADLPALSALHARVFGPGRFARTAYRVREARRDRTEAGSPFCRVALRGDEILASLRLTPITIGGTEGALLLGPLVVAPEIAGQGFGRALITGAIEDARAAGARLIVLVGDEPFYGRFGFRRVPPRQITLPGPADPSRILALELAPGAIDAYRGLIAADG